MNSAREEQQMTGLSEQAADWHLRYRDGDLSPAQNKAYMRWLTTSPQHVAEALRIRLLDVHLRRSGLGGIPVKAGEQNVIPFPQSSVRRGESAGTRPRRAIAWRAIAAAASLAVVAVLLMMFVRGAPEADQTIATAMGEWTKRLLDDGSVAHVAPSSELRTQFTAAVRSLALDRGEATFDVAKHPGRPFVVATKLGTVTAVGTHFGISYREDQVIVTVLEGEVAVRPKRRGRPGEPAAPPISLKANQQLVLSPDEAPRLIDPVDALRELKWLQNWVEADGETVAQMVLELNRRNQTQIVIEDPSMSRYRVFNFGFDPSRPEDLVERANLLSRGLQGKTAGGKAAVALRLERP